MYIIHYIHHIHYIHYIDDIHYIHYGTLERFRGSWRFASQNAARRDLIYYLWWESNKILLRKSVPHPFLMLLLLFAVGAFLCRCRRPGAVRLGFIIHYTNWCSLCKRCPAVRQAPTAVHYLWCSLFHYGISRAFPDGAILHESAVRTPVYYLWYPLYALLHFDGFADFYGFIIPAWQNYYFYYSYLLAKH